LERGGAPRSGPLIACRFAADLIEQGDEDRMHGADERLPIASLRHGVRLVDGLVRRLTA